MTGRVASLLPPASPFAGLATTLLAMPTAALVNPQSDCAQETRRVLELADYAPGRIYLMALQERAMTAEKTDPWLHWSGVIGAIKRVLHDHARGHWPEDDTR